MKEAKERKEDREGKPPSPPSLLSPGFTLIEVLMAFAILTSALVLVTIGLSRQLSALQILQKSVTAKALANRELIRAMLRRRLQEEIPANGSEGGLDWKLLVTKIPLEQDPVKDLPMEVWTAAVSWKFRNQERSSRVSTGFPSQKQ